MSRRKGRERPGAEAGLPPIYEGPEALAAPVPPRFGRRLTTGPPA